MSREKEQARAARSAWIALPIIIMVGAGLAWAGSSNSQGFNDMPLFALGVALAFVIQWIVFIPSFLTRTEKFFDLTGSITFLSVSGLAVALSGGPNLRAWILFALIAVWAVRLGSFLYSRIHKAGEDRRFRDIKQSFPRFLMTWSLQGLWVSFSLAAALAAITSQDSKALGLVGYIGIALWLIGFTIEVTADRQKSAFNANNKHESAFIRSGLWAWSRHPNYFGEIILWLGIAVIAFPVLSGWQYVTLISPIFVFVLLTRISGIPMLERRADEKWAGQEDYENYKANTPILIPRPPKQ